MAIYRTTVFVCDTCNTIVVTAETVSAYEDYAAFPPDGWDNYFRDGDPNTEMLACPNCARSVRDGD